MPVKDFAKLISELDQLVRLGQHGKVRHALFDLNSRQIEREFAAPLADIARRVNTPRFMLQLLEPYVRPEIEVKPPATLKEKALYATGLSRLGVYQEAEQLLGDLKTKDFSEAELFYAYNFIFQWNYLAAIPILKKYIARRDITEYSRLVAKINLLSCYSFEMLDAEAKKLFREINEEISKQNANGSFNLLLANSHEIAAQIEIKLANYDGARELIEKARTMLENSLSRYELFIKKWSAIIDLLEHPQDEAAREKFANLKLEGIKSKNWETLRDFEFYEALARREDALFLKVYYGTPHPNYRRRIKLMYKPEFTIPKTYSLGTNSAHAKVFDLEKGCEDGGAAPLAQHPVLLRLLKVLAQDFYRPVPMGTLASELYPAEYFNPESSPAKVLRAVKRLRAWFIENKIPVGIEVKNNNFKVFFNGPYLIRVGASGSVTAGLSKNDAFFEKMRGRLSEKFFTTKDVADVLGISVHSAQKFLSWANKSKKIIQVASGRSTRFKLK